MRTTSRSIALTHHSGARPSLRHLAFLEALAKTDESSPRWHAVTAGYAALQLFEWWSGHDGSIAVSSIEIHRVRDRTRAVAEHDPIRRCLAQLIDVVERSLNSHDRARGSTSDGEAGRIVAAYGKLLQYEASWSLSGDVFETLAAHARFVEDEEQLLDSMLMIAFSLRMVARFDVARDAYGALRERAAMADNEHYLLLSELGFAKIAIERGNLPAAAGMLDQLLVDVREGEHPAIRSKALMDRARVANQLGDLTSAALLGHKALDCATDPMERDRILVNIGMTLTHLGLWDEARDAYLLLTASAQEAAVRWMAQINLTEIAYLDRDERAFEQLRAALADVVLPPYLEAVFHETSAHGFCVFNRPSEAKAAFRRVLDVAERHGLNEFAVKAERAIEDISRTEIPLRDATRRCVGEQSLEIATVAHAITRMRVHAGL